MNNKTKTILFITLAIIFIIIAPLILLYSQGYRFDFQKYEILKTGGIYIKTSEPGAEIYIDEKYNNKTNQFLSYDFLVQNLIPKEHLIKVKKPEFVSWEKNLLVKEKMVTQAYIILFPEKINFTLVENELNKIYTIPGQNKIIAINSQNQIYVFENGQKTIILENAAKNINQILDVIMSKDSNQIIIKATEKKTNKIKFYLLPLNKETTELIDLKNLDKTMEKLSFYSNNIIYYDLGKKLYKETLDLQKATLVLYEPIQSFVIDGESLYFLQNNSLFRKNLITNNSEELSKQSLPLKENSAYDIFIYWGKIFILENQSNLYVLDENKTINKLIDSKTPLHYVDFYEKLLFYNDSQVWLYFLKDYESPFFVKANTLILLVNYEKINDLDWIGGDYFVRINENGQAIISEIDNRGKMNEFALEPTNITQVWFSQKDKKLYLLSNGNLLVSPKLIP
ncbi:MAG TPA: hypothetical protein P5095_01675 [Candidatus Paceibacterota bacterium]|nr:hypothetical protein [Candidatus Paceibacterota bacterium]